MAVLHTPTNNLEKSREFYRKLGFADMSVGGLELVSDGQIVIEINPDRYARAGVKFFADNWGGLIDNFTPLTKVVKSPTGYILSDPSNVWVYLEESKAPDSAEEDDLSRSVLGNFAGLSLETTDLERSLAFWNTLGFDTVAGSAEQGWVSCSSTDGLTVSIMKPLLCPHLFFNPSMTYFNGKDNLEVIRQIREVGIEIAEEITHFNSEGIVDNIILRDPGGYGFFVFSD